MLEVMPSRRLRDATVEDDLAHRVETDDLAARDGRAERAFGRDDLFGVVAGWAREGLRGTRPQATHLDAPRGSTARAIPA